MTYKLNILQNKKRGKANKIIHIIHTADIAHYTS